MRTTGIHPKALKPKIADLTLRQQFPNRQILRLK